MCRLDAHSVLGPPIQPLSTIQRCISNPTQAVPPENLASLDFRLYVDNQTHAARSEGEADLAESQGVAVLNVET